MRAALIGIVTTFALSIAGPGFAQDRSLQDRMGMAEFRAAGLDRLDVEQLARLDAWFARQLDGAVAEASTAAAAQSDSGVGLRAPQVAPVEVDSTLAGAFNGFAKGREYTLANGQVWRQTDAAVLPGVSLQDARVQIRPARLGGWWLKVADFNTRARVERVR